MEGAPEEQPQVLPNAQLSVSTRSPRSPSRTSCMAGTGQIQKPEFAVQVHTDRRKDASHNVMEPDKEYFVSNGHRQRYRAGGHSLRDRSSRPTKERWQQTDASSSCQAKLRQGSTSYNSHHPWCDDQELGRVMAVTHETSRFGQRAVADSFADSFGHMRSVRKEHFLY